MRWRYPRRVHTAHSTDRYRLPTLKYRKIIRYTPVVGLASIAVETGTTYLHQNRQTTKTRAWISVWNPYPPPPAHWYLFLVLTVAFIPSIFYIYCPSLPFNFPLMFLLLNPFLTHFLTFSSPFQIFTVLAKCHPLIPPPPTEKAAYFQYCIPCWWKRVGNHTVSYLVRWAEMADQP